MWFCRMPMAALASEPSASATATPQPPSISHSPRRNCAGGAAASAEVPASDTRVIFNQAIGARPILPRHFRLYFVLGSDELTSESAIAYRNVFEDIKPRLAYEVEVIGHTDTLGDRSYNQQLSLARAVAIRNKLTADGLAAGSISVTGRGELDLLVPTADQVAEPQNRRVEIVVR